MSQRNLFLLFNEADQITLDGYVVEAYFAFSPGQAGPHPAAEETLFRLETADEEVYWFADQQVEFADGSCKAMVYGEDGYEVKLNFFVVVELCDELLDD